MCAYLKNTITASAFGKDFLWGVAMAAQQNEGAWNVDGRGPSIWDVFARRQGKIKEGGKPTHACDFYYRYKDDLLLTKALGFSVFRFSISWSRVLPEGMGRTNKEGLAFYHKVIDECIQLGLTPYITLYHWDLPQALEKEGGWTNHNIIKWFARFVTVCAEEYGDKVKNWIVMNEPAGFTSLGYMLGKHAPGKTGLANFLPAIHHTVMATAEGGRVLRALVPNAHIGTTFSCSEIIPFTDTEEDKQAAKRVDILANRLFIEPALGRGYPRDDFKFMEKLEMHNHAWKYTERMHFNFDFIGLQNYFPVVVKYNALMPIIQASEVKAVTRKVPHTAMGWEINADSFYRIIKRFWLYGNVKEIFITESGAAFKDKLQNGVVNDAERINYHQQYLQALLKAKHEGMNVKGYFAWTLMDNFEWAEGYKTRFGLIHVDFNTQLRTIKNSGYWFRDFLQHS
ncbi:GH1 family beta-glucosidase [Limnovirga soli]|uniref:Beta-glucosidase n=1 Tax=Limnovirga soli TaxID=2656915 RepID=A0A8J8FBV2_9BACT|nr:GH1 family beta-glucosidase [Limnovirga soli]NNV55151.1 beta-glucosidase [Limnovirga soli]